MSSWPLISDFSRLLKTPKVAYKNPALREVEIELDAHGQPKPRSGNFATVFKGTRSDGSEVAIRVFNRRGDERRERYQVVSDYFKGHSAACLVGFDYEEEGIRSASDGKFYPLVTMDWVPGVTLFEWVRDRCREGYQDALTIGADVWLQLVRDLSSAGIVHGDLQHGNVLVSQEGYFKLVDYDCLSVPQLMGRPNIEIGMEPYQHPGRKADTLLFPGLDHFSSLVIYVALRALAASPPLWFTFVEHAGYDKLLFRKEDFQHPQNSHLYHALMTSPDEQVRDLTHYLFELSRYNLPDVPPIDEVLLWCNSLESLLSQGDWDTASQLIERMGEHEEIPSHLQGQAQQAGQRVRCRLALEEALKSGDEKKIRQCYVPELLDDYPAAAALVQQARQATEAIRILEVLEAARRFQNWDVFADTWLQNQSLLDKRVSAQPYKEEMQRLLTVRSLQKLLKDEKADDKTILEAWNYLQSIGSHPTAESIKSEVEKRTDRRNRLIKVRRLVETCPQPPTEKHDRLLAAVWKEELAQWDEAGKWAAACRQAQQRLNRLSRLRELTQQKTYEAEKELASTYRDLPAGYHPNLQRRGEKAGKRIKAHHGLQAAFKSPRSDLEILSAWEKVKQTGGEEIVSDKVLARVQLAERRKPLIEKLRNINTSQPLNQLDAEILAHWDDALLSECRDLEPLRPFYEQAALRQQALGVIRQAVQENNLPKAEEQLALPVLVGYQLPDDLKNQLAEIQGEAAEQRQHAKAAVVNTLRDNKPAIFADLFNASLVAEICQQYPHHQPLVSRWLESEILPHQRCGLTAGEIVHLAEQQYRITWTWPPPHFSRHCRFAVCRQQPSPWGHPDDADAVHTVRLAYEEWDPQAGYILTAESEWNDCYLTVWAEIDLGFQLFFSEALPLGQLKRSAPKKSRWGLFG